MSENTNRANPKPPSVDRLSQLWRRINEYKIAQWSVAYVALAYGVQHGVILTSESFEWPNMVARISMLLLALGLPLVMTFAWYHGERASRQFSRAELTIISILLVIGSLFFYVFVQPSAQVASGPRPAVKQTDLAAARAASITKAGTISIAVLPFTNLSGDAAQEFFSDGMTEEITTALAKISDLRVVARTSAYQFKGEKKDMRAVGQALGATHLIEGSVRKAGTRLRITAQLIKADDGTHIWTENYDRELTDVFAIQEDIATAIAGALRMPLGLAPGERLVSNRRIDPESYAEYLQAKALLRARSTEALKILEPLVVRNPDYAPAWAQLALAYAVGPRSLRNASVIEARRVRDDFLMKSEAAARRAIQLDPQFADGYVFLGRTQSARGKWLLAEELNSKALALDPNDPDALSQSSNVFGAVGRLKEALVTRQQLRALEPFVPVFNGNLADALWLSGQNDEAIAIDKGLPGTGALTDLARIYTTIGRYNEAADALQNAPSGAYPSGIAEEAARLLRTAPTAAVSPQSVPRLGSLGFIYLYVGDPSRALENYEESAEAGVFPATGITLLWHSAYASVRKTERFKLYVRNAGLVDYWRAKGWPEFCHPTTGDDFACK